MKPRAGYARIASYAMAAVLLARPLAAQNLAFQLGRLFSDGGWSSFTATWVRPVLGPSALALGGMMVQADGAPGRAAPRLWGATAELSLFRGGRPGAYAVAGLAGGIGTASAESWWRSWSAGVGYELLPLRFLSVAVEGRYRECGVSSRSGLEVSLRVAAGIGGRAPRATTATGAGGADGRLPLGLPAPSGRSLTRSDARRLVDGVIATADSAVGTRYRLGGRGEDGRGFDCSGLIQYAYGRHGIALPRTSGEQATQGREIGRELGGLQPGDLLTFSSSGHGVTHVGLYIGAGRFIHSASGGVQTSTLSADDPYGKWWYKRWVGTRRIVESQA